jgi:hypothetical protein
VFIHLPAASPQEAVAVGQAAAAAVTARLPPPMELKFEKVFAPLLLLHVNRCGGGARAADGVGASGLHKKRGTRAGIVPAAFPGGARSSLVGARRRRSSVGPCDLNATPPAHQTLGARGRYAGRAFETSAQAAEGRGALAIKGVKAIWRQSAPIVANTLQVGRRLSGQGPRTGPSMGAT